MSGPRNRWWEPDISEDDRWRRTIATARELDEARRPWYEAFRRYDLVYQHSTPDDGQEWEWLGDSDDGGDPPVIENVSESAIDFTTSVVAPNRPRPAFMTEGAEWSVQRQARQFSKYVEGDFWRLGAYELGPEMFRDGGVTGTGLIKCYADKNAKSPKLERAIVEEVLYDLVEARHREIRDIFQLRFIDRDALATAFSKERDKILSASTNGQQSDSWSAWTTYSSIPPHHVCVVEAWHLETVPGLSKDGRHTIAIDGALLLDEPYKRQRFPFVVYRWSKRRRQWYGRGIIEMTSTLQYRINRLSRWIVETQDLGSSAYWLIQQQETGLKAKMMALIGRVLVWKQYRPEYVAPEIVVPPEIYRYLERLVRRIYEIVGISELAATSQIPPRLESGRAIEEFNQIHTGRFAIQAQRYEACYTDLAEQCVWANEDLELAGVAPRTTWRGGQMDWSTSRLDKAPYAITIAPASILGLTPAGVSQKVSDWIELGIVSQAEVRELLGFADLRRIEDLETADFKLAEKVGEILLDETKPLPAPRPYMNLALTHRLIHQVLMKADMDGAPDDVLDRCRIYLDGVKALEERAKLEAAATGMPPGGPGAAAPPMAPPGAGQPAPPVPAAT